MTPNGIHGLKQGDPWTNFKNNPTIPIPLPDTAHKDPTSSPVLMASQAQYKITPNSEKCKIPKFSYRTKQVEPLINLHYHNPHPASYPPNPSNILNNHLSHAEPMLHKAVPLQK